MELWFSGGLQLGGLWAPEAIKKQVAASVKSTPKTPVMPKTTMPWFDSPLDVWVRGALPWTASNSKPVSISRISNSNPQQDNSLLQATYDILAWAPQEELISLYPEIKDEREPLLQFINDSQYAEADDNELYNLYPELSQNVKKAIREWFNNQNILKQELDKNRVSPFMQKVGNVARSAFGKEALTDDEYTKLKAEWKISWFSPRTWKQMLWDFKKIAFDDLWAVPSILAWAVAAPLKMWAWIVDIAWDMFDADIDAAESIDNVVDAVWVNRDWWFDTAKFATDMALSSAWVWAVLGGMSKVWQLANTIKARPKMANYIAKPLLEWIWYKAIGDAQKWEISSPKEYLRDVMINLPLNALWLGMSKLQNKLGNADEFILNSVKWVKPKFIENAIKETENFATNPWAKNPLKTIVSKLDDALNRMEIDKSNVGSKIWGMRDTLKTVSASTDDIVTKLNEALKANDIAASIIKTKNGYKVAGKVAKSEWAGTILKELAMQIDSLGQVGMKGKMAWVDKVNQYIKYLSKTSKMDGSLKNALGKVSSWFTKQIDDLLEWYGMSRWEYGKLSEMTEMLKEISSEGWDKSLGILRRMSNPESRESIKDLLKNLKELWYTQDDLLGELIATNYIMSAKLGKSEFQKAIEWVYPSFPWLLELWIKTTKDALFDTTKSLTKYAWKGADFYKDKMQWSLAGWLLKTGISKLSDENDKINELQAQ